MTLTEATQLTAEEAEPQTRTRGEERAWREDSAWARGAPSDQSGEANTGEGAWEAGRKALDSPGQSHTCALSLCSSHTGAWLEVLEKNPSTPLPLEAFPGPSSSRCPNLTRAILELVSTSPEIIYHHGIILNS